MQPPPVYTQLYVFSFPYGYQIEEDYTEMPVTNQTQIPGMPGMFMFEYERTFSELAENEMYQAQVYLRSGYAPGYNYTVVATEIWVQDN